MKPDKTWTLFLDRDGVINQRKMDEYVLHHDDFRWIDGVPQSIARLSDIFGKLIVVTNQQGIGKNLMTEEDLRLIHSKLIKGVEEAGGRIDKIYFCPALKEANSFFRKPLPGMALLAKKEFPSINFKKSVMVGDTISDMKFGKSLKMITVFIEQDKKLITDNHNLIDFAFPDLNKFTDFVVSE